MYYCFYHKNDLDGKCSGAIIKKFMDDNENKGEMIGIDYGDEFPWDKINKDVTVYMVDFSLQPFSNMVKLNEKTNLIWIDHHKSAMEELEKNDIDINGLRDNNKAACQLVWKFIYPEKKIPECIDLLGEYDIWNLNDKVLDFQFGSRVEDTENLLSNYWKNIFESNMDFIKNIIKNGIIIRQYKKIFDKEIMDAISYDIDWEGYKCLVCNFSHCNSDSFQSKWDNKKYDIMVAYKHVQGKYFTISIYTDKEGIDGSIISKKYGGGGHKQASGFQCDNLPWILKK